MSSERRTPGQRAGLSRDTVVRAARALLLSGGVEALSMRALARSLGVAPNALYSHVEGKDALVDEVLDDLLQLVTVPDVESAAPFSALARLLESTYEVLTAHPGLVPLYLARQGARGTNAVRLGQVMDLLLERAGVTGGAAAEARRILIVHTIGSAAFSTAAGLAGAPTQSAESPAGESFARGLRWLLAGIGASPQRGDPRHA